MTSELLRLASKVAERLISTEEAIDMAFREAAALAEFMPVARREAKVSASLGHNAFEEVVLTISKLSEARGAIIRTHQALADAQTRLGLKERNFGGYVDKPRHRGELKVVAPSGAAS